MSADKPAAPAGTVPQDVLLSWHIRAHNGAVIVWFSQPVDFLSLPRALAVQMRDGLDKAIALMPPPAH